MHDSAFENTDARFEGKALARACAANAEGNVPARKDANATLAGIAAVMVLLGMLLMAITTVCTDEAFALESQNAQTLLMAAGGKSSTGELAANAEAQDGAGTNTASEQSRELVAAQNEADEELQSSVSAAAAQVGQKIEETQKAAAEKTDKVLDYSAADIEAIGNQDESGHSICCPSYACAYADAVLDGTVNDHSYYSCSCCMWTDWGGGNSSYRCVGADEEVLREAYDEILAGRPTVTHVSWAGGQHWITLIGYENAYDPDHLALENFIALDPSNGQQVNAAYRFALYGDGCQHVSER